MNTHWWLTSEIIALMRILMPNAEANATRHNGSDLAPVLQWWHRIPHHFDLSWNRWCTVGHWTCSYLTSISHVEVELHFQHWKCLAGKDSCPNLYHHWDAGHLMTYRYNPNRFWIDKFHTLCMGEFNLVHVKEPLKSILNKNLYGLNQGRKFTTLPFSCPSAGWVVE